MFVCCECCVLSGRGLCDGLINRSEESYRLWRVVVCDQETSKTRRLKPATGLWKIQPQWVVTPRKQTTNNIIWYCIILYSIIVIHIATVCTWLEFNFNARNGKYKKYPRCSNLRCNWIHLALSNIFNRLILIISSLLILSLLSDCFRWSFLIFVIITMMIFRDCKRPPRCKSDLHSSGILCRVDWWVGSLIKKGQTLLDCQVAGTFRMGLIGCPKRSVTNYQWRPRKIPEERKCHLIVTLIPSPIYGHANSHVTG